MPKMFIDLHTHTKFSPDGRGTIEEMLRKADDIAIDFYGISEHFDTSKERLKRIQMGALPPETDATRYFPKARKLQKQYEGIMNILVGAELGFMDDEISIKRYNELIERYKPDYIINSVHRIGNGYYTRGKSGEKIVREKRIVYNEYFDFVLRSLDVPYHYDIVGHLGYCTRYAPYADKRAPLEEYGDQIDRILKRIVELGKILEVNSKDEGGQILPEVGDFFCLPNVEVLKRYYQLGGRKVVYGSDAHGPEVIGYNACNVIKMLKEIGFTHQTIPYKGKEIYVEL